jgi:bifunctional NMN adenylyltransferase/nudix hydrolase
MNKGAGVVVGRFQVPDLHEGHKKLISIAQVNHKKLIVFIACTIVKGSDKDPLDFDTRAAMVKYQFPSAIVKPIYDHPCDKKWSQILDGEIYKEAGRSGANLYSSKNGFHKHYHGDYHVRYIPEIDFYRGTEIREIMGQIVPTSKEGRCGVIYGIVNQYPRIFQVVDMAVIKNDEGKLSVLLGTKKDQEGLRFPGGFVDQTDESLEKAAQREVYEECGGISTDDYEYICSYVIDDWRFKGRPEKIMSSFFKCKYGWGTYHEACNKPDSEFIKLQFYPINKVTLAKMGSQHKKFFSALIENVSKTEPEKSGILDQ